MDEGTPDFWEWVKNKIREREQQQPLQIEIQLPIVPDFIPSSPTNGSDGIYEEVNHEIKNDIYQMKATSMVAFSFVISHI